MKIYTSLLFLAAAMALAAPVPDAAEECGDLGAMHVDPKNLPDGVTLADVCKCANHPSGEIFRSWKTALKHHGVLRNLIDGGCTRTRALDLLDSRFISSHLVRMILTLLKQILTCYNTML